MPFLKKSDILPHLRKRTDEKPEDPESEEAKPDVPIPLPPQQTVTITSPRQAAPLPVPRSSDEISLVALQQTSSDFRKFHKYDSSPAQARILARSLERELRKTLSKFAPSREEAQMQWEELKDELQRTHGVDTPAYVEAVDIALGWERASHGQDGVFQPPTLGAVPSDAIQDSLRIAPDEFQSPPGDYGVLQIAHLIKEAIELKRLVILVIDLDPELGLAFGGGKSQLRYQILQKAYHALGLAYDERKDTVFGKDLERYSRLFTGRTIDGKMDVTNRPWGVDEATQLFDKWGWNKGENQERTRGLELYRKSGRPIVMCCGSIWLLNERMREVIITHRLMVTKWDDRRHIGEFRLFRKWGTAANQKEEENRWGDVKNPLLISSFEGLKKNQFTLMDTLANTAMSHLDEKGWTMDSLLREDNGWLAELLEQPLGVETRTLKPSKHKLSDAIFKP